MIRSGLILTFFHFVVAVLGLVRNFVIARWLSVEDFGVASTLALTMALVEMSTNIGLDRLIVQSKDGDSERFQNTLHSFQLLRGMGGAVILFFLAYPLSEIFHSPSALWAYQAMALLPVMRSFVHLDLNRFQRARVFWPALATETVAQVVSTAVALGWAYQGGDYSCMLYGLIAQWLTWSLLSQLLAERRFRFSWDAAIIKNAVGFGWPLLLNGAMMFGIFYGDRVTVGNRFGPGVLGWFSVAYMLTLIPSTLLMRVSQTLSLPVLAQHQDDPDRLKYTAFVATELGFLFAILLIMGSALCGGIFIHALFGAKYDLATGVLVPLAAVQALRLAKSGPSVVAISLRQTTNPMWANLARVGFLPVAFVAASLGASVLEVVWIALVGELAGLVLSLVLLSRKSGLDVSRLISSLIALILCASAALIYDYTVPGQASAILGWYGLILTAATAIYILSMKHLIGWVKVRIRSKAAGV